MRLLKEKTLLGVFKPKKKRLPSAEAELPQEAGNRVADLAQATLSGKSGLSTSYNNVRQQKGSEGK
jgi:hypothetical protein